MRYKNHSVIMAAIPDYFYPAMLGELVSIVGAFVIDTGRAYGDLNSGTYGWTCALRQTCDKLGLNWIMDYWDSLEWYDSDQFDGEIEARCCELIEHQHRDDVMDRHMSYYKELCKKFDSKGQ